MGVAEMILLPLVGPNHLPTKRNEVGISHYDSDSHVRRSVLFFASAGKLFLLNFRGLWLGPKTSTMKSKIAKFEKFFPLIKFISQV
jgi:hypothetical protein